MAKTALQIQADYTSQLAQGKSPNQHEFTQALATAQNLENKAKDRGVVSPKVQRKETRMGGSYVTGADPKKDYEKYVKQNKDLEEAFEEIQKGDTKQSEYWLRRMGGGTDITSFGRAHAGEAAAIVGDSYLGTLGEDAGRVKLRDIPGIRKEKVVTTTGDDETEVDVDHDPDAGGGSQSVITGLQPFSMAELTDDMLLSNRLRDIINKDSALFKAARQRALAEMNKRGIVNSSIAEEAVMNALLAVAMPIAQAEVNALQTNLYYNTDWTNAQKQMANDYYYRTMIAKLGKEMDYQLNYMVQSFGAWGKYGDWISKIGTTPGMDVGAVDWNLNQMPQLPPWFYGQQR